MNRSWTLARRLTKWGVRVALCLALASPGTAWAEGKKKQQETAEPEQAYLLPYIVTGLAVLVGMGVLCMPSQRKDEVDMSP